MSGTSYAGDVSPREAWRILSEDAGAALIDVRTDAEWRYVGLPDLSGLDKSTHCVAWQVFPDLRHNPDFVADVEGCGLERTRTLLLICRSGQRSRDAAIALTTAGYECCYNVADGFEGPRDAEGHRGTAAGWKVSGLPWGQG